MTAISVSERLLEMAAFYTWLDFTLTKYTRYTLVRAILTSVKLVFSELHFAWYWLIRQMIAAI